ncbi:LysE family translocator [Hyphomicrobiales bacterium]|jgi:threonine/homoserine/homoserine lactone efflux protein|nr:LysE family translocator [Rhodobiaceae bacterium]MDB4127999.1 LysE family translocator [Hyphomicrobiales bacterium]MBT5641463.1 LysE family translocator [Rhodobiaceae bacterium]MBT6222314.1 LysE family translocator [Rhodobiaceae bacterium]MDB4831834.1 LysE family translocator [Hyphomicrobiales bacterium]
MGIETFSAFVIASVVLVFVPGPTVLLVISYALAQGRSVALAVVCGATLGVTVSMTATIFGLGVILATSATLFTVIKWIGVGYLVWMGLRMILTAKKAPSKISTSIGKSHFSAFRDSAIVTLLNPKSIGFFIVFVPQFIDTSSPVEPQFAIMIVTFVVIGAINTLGYALLAAQIRHIITRPKTLIWIQYAGGFTLLGLAIYTATLRLF